MQIKGVEIKPIYWFFALCLIMGAGIFLLTIPEGLSSSCQSQTSAYLYCNQISTGWQQALTFINNTYGSQGNSSVVINNSSGYFLSWWDYGDWLNWYGHVPSVIRGDNQVPTLDYNTAYEFVDGNANSLANFMLSQDSHYVVLSSDELGKWGALNYLSCIYENATTLTTAVGSSGCEINNNPSYIIFPAPASNGQEPSILDYCNNIVNANYTYVKAEDSQGNEYCLEEINSNGQVQLDGKIYAANSTGSGMVIPYLNMIPYTQQESNGQELDIYIELYVPTTSCTYTGEGNVPQFYQSPYYMLYFMGCTNGAYSMFTNVYGSGSSEVRIFQLESNYTIT